MKTQQRYYTAETILKASEQIHEWKKKMVHKIPHELTKHFNSTNYQSIINNVWIATPQKRPFSPLIKSIAPNVEIPVSEPFTKGEREYIKEVAINLHREYGKPKFKYSGKFDDEESASVKQWQGLLRISPKITVGSSERRYEAVLKYERKHIFKPDAALLAKAANLFLDIANVDKVKIDFEPTKMKGLFAKHSSNVGYPYFANEKSLYHGITMREHTVAVTKELNDKYGSWWMTAIPALIIGRDQPGGIDLDMSKEYTFEELLGKLETAKYKPNKARPVFAIDRISNNNINTLLNGVIYSPSFQANPFFSSFKSREDRKPHYKQYHKAMRDMKLIPLNVDYSSFDTTVSAEMISMAMDIFSQWVDIVGGPDDLLPAIAVKTAFTKYIVYNPTTQKTELKQKSGAIPSGIGLTGIIGLIVAQVAWIYALMKLYGTEFVTNTFTRIRDEYKTFPSIGLGDDVLSWCRDAADLVKLADIINETFGMEISVESTKTAIGVDFLQELYIHESDSIMYPTGRTAVSALYTERPKGLGWAEWVFAFSSMLFNMKTNPKGDLVSMAALISRYDKTRLGLVNPDTGKDCTSKELVAEASKQAAEHNSTIKEALWDGDPSKENRYGEDGKPVTDYLAWQRAVALAAEKALSGSNKKFTKETKQ